MVNATEALVIRYPVEIRWARERGWIRVRDAFSGEWHEVLADQVPPWWRRQAQIEKLRTTAAGARN
jgi:hypothetical protein